MAYQTKASLRHQQDYAKKTKVDDPLFASTRYNDYGPVDTAIISKSKMSTIQGIIGGPASVTLSASDLKRMQFLASGEAERQAAAAGEAASAAKRAAAQKAQARKDKMRQLEEERKLKLQPTESEMAKAEAKARVVSGAEKKLAQELDDVKKMDQMCLYSKVVTIRDAQVNEKKIIEKERQEEERRLDTIMEIERLKALKMYEEREARRAIDNQLGAQVIQDQMQMREKERLRRLELQDQERLALIKQNEDMKAEERAQQAAKAEAGKKLLKEVALSNAEQIALKKKAAEAEKMEERRIQAYIRDKERREQDHHAEQERIKQEREMETARLRAAQEKMADKQAELDALRAKRAVEEAERTWRKKEREEVERQVQINNTLSKAREAQRLEKERRLIEQAQQERDEFIRILGVQRDADSIEKTEKSRKQGELCKHQEELQSQILMNAEVRKKNRMDFLQEGKQMRNNMDAERNKLEEIKKDKLSNLHKAGVPEKYTVDLQHKKFT